MRYLRGFAFELMHVAGRRAIDGNSPWLHRLGDFPDKFDSQETILECGVLHLNVISEVELPLERPARKYLDRDIRARSCPPCCPRW